MQKNNALAVLKKYFHFNAFRSGQQEIIQSLLDGRDTLGIMPTGSGKSICYQVPALILPGLTLIISPLIALMKDQVDALQKLKIPATFLNSTLNRNETETRIQELREGQYKMLYVAPERFRVGSFRKLIHQLEISLLAVDEAHCISQWGHDFRPSYLRIKDIIQETGHPTVVALTATATRHVQQDIVKQLELKSPKVVVRGFDRPNLKLFAVEFEDEQQKQKEMLRIIQSVPGSGIVYVATQKTVEEITSTLNSHDIPAIGYHGGMNKIERNSAQNRWLANQVRMVVATNAFGMGIDKADVRLVLHYNIPGSVEAYYQEAGRAGRDGKTSFCVLFFSHRDHIIQQYLIEASFPPEDILKDIYDFLFSLGRKQILLTYREIASMVDCGEMQVASAVKLFERYKIVKRLERKVLTYEVDFLMPLSQARKKVARAALQKKVLDFLSNDIAKRFTIRETLKKTGLSEDQLNRVMRELVGKGILAYTPPFRGRGIELTSVRVEWDKIPIDFDEYEKQMQIQFAHLEEMELYVTKRICRRKYILDYFGEKYSKENCGACDICLNWHSPLAEEKSAKRNDMQTLLECVLEFDGTFGVTTIASILKGMYEKRFEYWNADSSPYFGAMMEKDKNKIMRMIFAAIKKGYLKRKSGQYPTLEITRDGLEYLRKK